LPEPKDGSEITSEDEKELRRVGALAVMTLSELASATMLLTLIDLLPPWPKSNESS